MGPATVDLGKGGQPRSWSCPWPLQHTDGPDATMTDAARHMGSVHATTKYGGDQGETRM